MGSKVSGLFVHRLDGADEGDVAERGAMGSGIDGEGGALGAGFVAEAIEDGGFEGVGAGVGGEVALHGDELALLAAQHVGGFVAGDVFAEALEDGAFVVLDEGDDGEVDGGEVGIGVVVDLKLREGDFDGERAAVAVGQFAEAEDGGVEGNGGG